MAAKSLQKLAQLLDWKEEKNFIWGFLDGYLFSIRQGQGFKQIIWSGGKDNQLDKVLLQLKARKKEHGAKGVFIHGNFISLRYAESFRSARPEKIQSLLSVFADVLFNSAVTKNDTCIECGTASNSTAFINEVPMTICDACYMKLEQDLYLAEREYEQTDKKYAMGSIGAMWGALVGTVPWIIVAYFGYLAAFLGYLIGQASLKGYKIFGGVVGPGTKWIILLATVISLALAQVVMLVITMIQHELPITLDTFTLIITYPGILSAMAKDTILSLIMAGLGIWPLFSHIKEHGQMPRIERAEV